MHGFQQFLYQNKLTLKFYLFFKFYFYLLGITMETHLEKNRQITTRKSAVKSQLV